MCALSDDWGEFFALEQRRRDQGGLNRVTRAYERLDAIHVGRNGKELLNFSSNDYLGLSMDNKLIEATRAGASRGAGATASRLIVGTDVCCEALEEKLAHFVGTEQALIFSSGYLANLGVITALVSNEDAIVSDELNHASIIDASRLSRARVYRFAHRDVESLRRALGEATRDGARRTLIVTESVFSMDGDVAPLRDIVDAKHDFGAALMVDEAHADGVFGAGGRGYCDELGVSEHVDIHVGTFGKAFGVFGAFVAGKSPWINQLRNSSRSFIFTTAMPPAVISAIDTALDVVQGADDLRQNLRVRSQRLREGFVARGIDIAGSTTQIVPLVVGEATDTLSLSSELENQGVLAVAIRPPTVPKGSSRIRFSLSAEHRDEDIDFVFSAVDCAREKVASQSVA